MPPGSLTVNILHKYLIYGCTLILVLKTKTRTQGGSLVATSAARPATGAVRWVARRT